MIKGYYLLLLRVGDLGYYGHVVHLGRVVPPVLFVPRISALAFRVLAARAEVDQFTRKNRKSVRSGGLWRRRRAAGETGAEGRPAGGWHLWLSEKYHRYTRVFIGNNSNL